MGNQLGKPLEKVYVFFVFLTDTCTGTACTLLAFNTFSDRFSEVLRQICTEKVKTQKVSETQDPVGSISPRAHSQGSRFVLFLALGLGCWSLRLLLALTYSTRDS